MKCPDFSISRKQAEKIFKRWWMKKLLKQEMLPKKVLRVVYNRVEENQGEVRQKVLALCLLTNGKKLYMIARRNWNRGKATPTVRYVSRATQIDIDESESLYDDSPVGRDVFARRALEDLKRREQEAEHRLSHKTMQKRIKKLRDNRK